MSEVEELTARRQMVDDLRARGVDPYPPRVSRTHAAAEAVAAFDPELPEDEAESRPPISIAGRMVTQRVQGKAGFAHVQDGSGRVQIYCRQDVVGEETYMLSGISTLVTSSGPRGICSGPARARSPSRPAKSA